MDFPELPHTGRHRTDLVSTIVVLVYCVYAALFIFRTSFVLDGERYFSLFDDAMISMRYAKNLASGHGLSWNPGDKVEGFTNPLWTIYMAVFHLLRIPASKTSLFVQISSALFLIANLLVLKRVARLVSGGSVFVTYASLILTAFYLPLNNWALQGMEVGVLAFLMTLASYFVLQAISGKRSVIVPYLVLGFSTLVRIDMAVTFAGVLLFAVWALPHDRRRNLLTGMIILAVFVVGQTALRKWYYGEALPNTYYLKMTGYPIFERVFRGFYVALRFMWTPALVFFAIPLVVLLATRDRKLIFLGWVVLTQILYSVFVGGDAWESWGGANRYICVAMPAFFVLLARSLSETGSYLRGKISAANETGRFSTLVRDHPHRIVVLVLVFALLSFNSIQGPIALTEWLLLSLPLHVDRNQEMVKTGLLMREITKPEARLAVVWDGAIPYFSDRYCISLIGKNDHRIARVPMRTYPLPEGLLAFFPGHMKWDYAYSIGELKPDVVVQLWMKVEEAMPYLDKSYVRVLLKGCALHLLKNSPRIRWDVVRTMIPPQS